jgi:hypothetical protein
MDGEFGCHNVLRGSFVESHQLRVLHHEMLGILGILLTPHFQTQLEGFSHDDAVHQLCFFEPGQNSRGKGDSSAWNGRSSLNTLGYSPITLSEYLGYINEIVGQRHLGTE